jgi:hypothetical protein
MGHEVLWRISIELLLPWEVIDVVDQAVIVSFLNHDCRGKTYSERTTVGGTS